MLVALLNDTHAGARNASDVFLNYIARFYNEIFFPYCDEHGIKQILHLGDYYDHRKYINFKALHHNRKTFLEPMRDRGMTMDIIPGNHDVFWKNTNDLNALKELLGYFTKEVNLVLKPTVMNYRDCQIALVPWINQENIHDSVKFLETCPTSIVAGHFELAGFEMMRGMPPAAHGTIETNILDRFEMVLSGHYHTKSSKGNIHYLGTQYEMTWSDVNDPKYFHVFDTETRQLTKVRNPLTIFNKIIYDDFQNDYSKYDVTGLANSFVKIIVTSKGNPGMFDDFVDAISAVGPHELKIAETYEEFTGANVNSEEIEKVTDTSDLLGVYVDAIDTSLDKDLLKTKLKELYVEAQTFETV